MTARETFSWLNALAIGTVLTIVGCANIFTLCRNRILARRSRSWHTTTGQIYNAYLWNGHLGMMGGFKVDYWYKVAGQQYTGNRIAFGSSWVSLSPQTAEATLRRRYPFGADVTVYYDPQHPQQAVLERRTAGTLHSCFICFLCFLMVGLLGVLK